MLVLASRDRRPRGFGRRIKGLAIDRLVSIDGFTVKARAPSFERPAARGDVDLVVGCDQIKVAPPASARGVRGVIIPTAKTDLFLTDETGPEDDGR